MGLTEQINEIHVSQGVQTEILRRVEGALSDVKITLHGRPGKEKYGLVSRFEKLETWDRSKNKVIWFLGTAAVSCVLGWIFSKI